MKKVIGINERDEKKYLEDQRIKKESYLNLLKYITKFIDIETIDCDSETLLNDVRTQFLKVNRQSFPPIVKDAKIFELVDFDLSKLERLINTYQSIKINWDSRTGKFENRDFNIYAETKQEIERLNASNELKEVFNKHLEILPMGLLPKQQIASYFKNIVLFDYHTNRFGINVNYIKGLI